MQDKMMATAFWKLENEHSNDNCSWSRESESQCMGRGAVPRQRGSNRNSRKLSGFRVAGYLCVCWGGSCPSLMHMGSADLPSEAHPQERVCSASAGPRTV